MKIKSFAAGLFLFSSAASAQSWTSTGDFPEFVAYSDRTRLQVKGSVRKMWMLYDFKQNKCVDGVCARSAKTLFEVNCSDMKSRVTETYFYDHPMGKGQHFAATIARNPELQPSEPVRPGTLVAHTANYMCSQK